MNIKLVNLTCLTFFCCCILILPNTLSSCAKNLDQIQATKENSNVQNAVNAVFQKIKKDPTLKELTNDFPKVVGSKKGNINVGGPPPGVKVVAIFETVVKSVDQNVYEVYLNRRWKEGVTSDGELQPVFGDISNISTPLKKEKNLQTLSTTWKFRVELNSNVKYLGRSGCDIFQYKVPQKQFCKLPK